MGEHQGPRRCALGVPNSPGLQAVQKEEPSHNEPHVSIATERSRVALPREGMPNALMYTQPSVTEQTLLEVLRYIWGKSENNRGVNSSEG